MVLILERIPVRLSFIEASHHVNLQELLSEISESDNEEGKVFASHSDGSCTEITLTIREGVSTLHDFYQIPDFSSMVSSMAYIIFCAPQILTLINLPGKEEAEKMSIELEDFKSIQKILSS